MSRLFALLPLLTSLDAFAAEPGQAVLLTTPILEDGGERFVNINNSHRSVRELLEEAPKARVVETRDGPALVVGVAELLVTIDNTHRTAGGGELYVTIDNTH